MPRADGVRVFFDLAGVGDAVTSRAFEVDIELPAAAASPG